MKTTEFANEMLRLYINVIVLVIFYEFDVNYAFANFQEQYNDTVTDYFNCVCVPYWQCEEDYSGVIDDGNDLMDIRVLRNAENSPTPCTGDFDVCCHIQCGMRKRTVVADAEGMLYRKQHDYSEVFGFRILGDNNEAEFAEFPWMLGILIDRTFRCGASLIHPKVALTAAHCVYDNKGPYKVRAGEWNWESRDEILPHQDRLTEQVIIHSQYHSGSLRNDIALLVLQTPFKLTENVGIACIPPQSMMYDDTMCVTSGWGKNSYTKGTYQSTLKKMNLPVVGRQKCLKSLRDARLGPLFHLHRSFICAGGEANKDTCKGDGGSPLVCPIIGQDDRYEQVGIVSWGLTCGYRNTPGVYVNVALFSDWIDGNMLKLNFNINIYRY